MKRTPSSPPTRLSVTFTHSLAFEPCPFTSVSPMKPSPHSARRAQACAAAAAALTVSVCPYALEFDLDRLFSRAKRFSPRRLADLSATQTSAISTGAFAEQTTGAACTAVSAPPSAPESAPGSAPSMSDGSGSNARLATESKCANRLDHRGASLNTCAVSAAIASALGSYAPRDLSVANAVKAPAGRTDESFDPESFDEPSDLRRTRSMNSDSAAAASVRKISPGTSTPAPTQRASDDSRLTRVSTRVSPDFSSPEASRSLVTRPAGTCLAKTSGDLAAAKESARRNEPAPSASPITHRSHRSNHCAHACESSAPGSAPSAPKSAPVSSLERKKESRAVSAATRAEVIGEFSDSVRRRSNLIAPATSSPSSTRASK